MALLSRREEIVKDTPNFDKKKFLYYLSRADYEKEWGSVYRKPGIGTRILAFFLKVIPKVGPFKAAAFKIPTTQSEDMYIKSVNRTVEDFARRRAGGSTCQTRIVIPAGRPGRENTCLVTRLMRACWINSRSMILLRSRPSCVRIFWHSMRT